MWNLAAGTRAAHPGLSGQPAERQADLAPGLVAMGLPESRSSGSRRNVPRLPSAPFILALLIVVALAAALWWTA